MSSLYKSPGVHIESAGDRYLPLERVETGVTAFLGVTDQGPRHQPTRVGSFEQYEKVFGASDSTMTYPLPGDGLEEAIAWRARFDSSHASFYFPWIKVRKREDVLLEVPPSGHVAGLIAQNDRQEGVHRAPANQPLQGLVDVARRVRKRE